MATSKIKNQTMTTLEFSTSVEIQPNTNTRVEIPITTPNGYQPIGIVAYDLGTQFLTAFTYSVNANTNKAVINVRSNRSDAVTITCKATVLFAPI